MRNTGHRASRSERSERGRRGQAETIGVVLLLGLVVASTTLVVAYGSTAIGDVQSQSQAERAGHSMTLFDANAATVALGDSTVRSVDFAGYEGDYSVDPTEGYITITHANYTSDGGDTNAVDDGSGDNDHILYESSLGTTTYRDGETTIAYQGGGVWRRGATGGSTMLSPPEFHYRGATLTLPVIRVTSGSSGSGAQTAVITRDTSGTSVFPDKTEDYPDGDLFQNPTEEGEIHVTIQSKYYQAWGDFFENRTEGEVRYDDAAETVTVELVTTGNKGVFVMPGEGGSISIRGLLGGHSLQEFGITTRPDDTDSADFSNLKWSVYAEDGDQQLEMHLRRTGGGKTCSDPVTASLTIYYSEDGGDNYHGWYADDAYTGSCDANDNVQLESEFSDDDDDDSRYDDVEPNDPELEYTSLSKSQLVHFNPNGNLVTSPTFDEHSGSVGWEPKSYTAGETETVDRLVAHYFGIMGPTIELTVDDKNSDTVNEAASGGIVEYEGSNKYITFLHVTENGIEVRFE